MYLEHFGLREPPFSLTPDTSFIFASATHQEALNTLLVAARGGEGFIKIVGEVGNGKTLLCRKFLATLSADKTAARFVTAYIPNPYLDPRSLLLALAGEFRIEVASTIDQHHLLKALTLALLNFAREGKRVLVCLDEAQAMPLESLEVLRLLTNLETEKRKLMQVVLFGQPELDERLTHNSVRQLRQRISFQYRLRGLRKDELHRYLRHRLQVAGYSGEPPFRRSAVATLHYATRGTPRLVNILAHKALLLAYGEGLRQVTSRHLHRAISDTPEARKDLRGWLWGSLAALGLLMLMLSGGWQR